MASIYDTETAETKQESSVSTYLYQFLFNYLLYLLIYIYNCVMVAFLKAETCSKQ